MNQDTRSIAERVLSDAWGVTIKLDLNEDLDTSARSHVQRYTVRSGPPELPGSVIVKQALAVGEESYDAASASGPAWRLFNEWAGLQFLTELAGSESPAPGFHGGSREAGLLVIEDLGPAKRLDQLLLGDDPQAATDGLRAYIAAMGRMHAMTLGRRAAYDRIRDRLGPGKPEPDPMRTLGMVVHIVRQFVEGAGIKLRPGIETDFAALMPLLDRESPFMAYSHSDPCPDNCLIADHTARLVDFEIGGYRHALLDGVYGRALFPSCWCTNQLPSRICEEMEEIYRLELARGCPAATDVERFRRMVVEACAWRLLTTLYPEHLKRDQVWGISTLRQRTLARLDRFTEVSAAVGHLKLLGAMAGELAAVLRAQWPSEASEMPVYPAFR